MFLQYVRMGGRYIRFAWVIGTAAVSYFLTVWLRGRSGERSARAGWMCRHARRVLWAANCEVTCQGVPPADGLVAANHLGYLDIIVLGSVQPTIFLSKSEVRRWPIFGALAACGGTLFIRRDRKGDVARFDDAFAEVVRSGAVLAIFPEGTSTDGHRVLPFHSSLFQAAANAQWRVTPVWLGYAVPEGSVENDVCYWGDMTFFPHIRRLLSLKNIRATVAYGPALPPGMDRKEMAKVLHGQVCELAGRHRPGGLAAESSQAG